MVILLSSSFFPFSLRGRAKEWLQSLPRNSIDSWGKCKDAFIGKYNPPAKIIQLRSNIMNFRQLDNDRPPIPDQFRGVRHLRPYRTSKGAIFKLA